MSAIRVRAVRAAQQTTAYRWTRGKAVRWLRRSATGRKLARAAGYGGRGAAAWVPFTAGHGVPAELAQDMEPVLFVAAGLTTEQVEPLLEEIQRRQLEEAIRPVLLVTGDAMAAVRRYGFVVECLVPEEQWTAEWSWAAYLRGHQARICRQYGISVVAVLNRRAVSA